MSTLSPPTVFWAEDRELVAGLPEEIEEEQPRRHRQDDTELSH